MNDLKNRMSLRIAKLALTNKLASYPLHDGFKIGKTTQTIEERFAEKYSDDYDSIAVAIANRNGQQYYVEVLG